MCPCKLHMHVNYDGKGRQCGRGSQSTPVAARTRSKPSYLVLVRLHSCISHLAIHVNRCHNDVKLL